jgi:hypothetical protein
MNPTSALLRETIAAHGPARTPAQAVWLESMRKLAERFDQYKGPAYEIVGSGATLKIQRIKSHEPKP